ncbi:MAG: hypothetical protein AB8B55_03320 [Mariniblastus sp.]
MQERVSNGDKSSDPQNEASKELLNKLGEPLQIESVPGSFSSRAQIRGVFLMLLSGVFFFTMLSVPWFPISRSLQLILGTGLFICVQVAWWAGVALAGSGALAFLRKRT